jgi:hypothetical protein
MIWPNGRKAAFAIIDDTDDAEMPGISDVYDLLIEYQIPTTKTVWVYPVKDTHLFRGNSLTGDPAYLEFIKKLIKNGYEIGLHNVGSGDFTRVEILHGLEEFNNLLGFYPNLHVNHSYNPDNIYGGDKRFSFPFDYLVRLIHSSYTGFSGELKTSKHFWGDAHKRHIRFSRSYELDDLNLLRHCHFPYKDQMYSDYCNLFYPSVFCSNQDLFNARISDRNLQNLISQNGCSIIYTHFGYFTERGGIEQDFRNSLELLKKYSSDIWFAPVSEILCYLERTNGVRHISRNHKFLLEAKSLITRVKYRYFSKLDDYHYKTSLGAKHRNFKHK